MRLKILNYCSLVLVLVALASCSGGSTLAVGDSYQGGKVAYILQSGDPGYISGVQQGIIAAPSDQSTGAEWGCVGTEIRGTNEDPCPSVSHGMCTLGTAIGTGAQNTIDIMNACATAGIAARVCDALSLGGYSGWFLPSKDELNKLYTNRTAIGGFANAIYWSSSENGSYDSFAQWFDFDGHNGDQDGDVKSVPDHVRCIRTFIVNNNNGTVAVGDTYQGGKVAYLFQSGDTGYKAGEQHGLIAAPSDQSTGAAWGCNGTAISGADGTAIGTGKQNTADIMNGCSTSGIAAKLCDDLTLGGYSDWYLPSKDELKELYNNQTAIGGFATNMYWSSSEADASDAWFQGMPDAVQDIATKDTTDYVRCVRTF